MTRVAATGISAKNYRVPWRTGVKCESVSSENDWMAAAVIFPGSVCVTTQKKEEVIDIHHFHASLAHAHWSVLKTTAQQHGILLFGELAPLAGCSMAEGICTPTPHHTTPRAVVPIDMVHINTVRPYQESLKVSRYVVMFVHSASRL